MHDAPRSDAAPDHFAFLLQTTGSEPCSIEEIGLDVVFDSPSLAGTRPGQLAERGRVAPDVSAEHSENEHSWPWILLVSYASAVTLAMIWILWTGRHLPPARITVTTSDSATSTPDALPSHISPEFAPTDDSQSPLPIQNLTPLGKSIRFGAIEVTPLSVERGQIELHRRIEPHESRWTKTKSLILRLRLSNLSSDRTFVPLEVGSARESPGNRKETFLESERGRIGMYPLAMESEWNIAGQQFPSLKPGESAETLLVTAPIVDDQIGDTLTWHACLRVNPHQTDVIGVTFSRSDIFNQ